MRPTVLRLPALILALTLTSIGGPIDADAAELTIDADDSGFVTETGGSSKYDGLATPGATYNYSVGFEVHFVDGGSGGPGGIAPMMRKNYFVFDLTAITDPILSATLMLYNPVGGYESTDPTETFVLAGSGSPTILGDLETMATLTPPLGPPEVALAVSIYGAVNDTLGSLPDFGTAVMSPVDDDTTVMVPLTLEGVGYLNTALGGKVVLGGTVTSAVPPLPVPQAVFGFTEPEFTSPKAMMMITTEDPPPPTPVPVSDAANAVLLSALLVVAIRRVLARSTARARR